MSICADTTGGEKRRGGGGGRKKSQYQEIQGVSVNRKILQHCFFWFGNTGADAAIAILLAILKHFSFNGAMD